MADARALGVREPGRVRVAATPAIPANLPLALRWLTFAVERGLRDAVGIALGHGLYVRRDFAGDRALLVHELGHVAQYERLGRTEFLTRYIAEFLQRGYPNGALEPEAVVRARALCTVGLQDPLVPQ